MGTLDKIIMLLKAQNKKQIDLCNYIGVKKNAFTAWKSGVNRSYLKYIAEIAEFFNVSTDYLLGKTENIHGTDDEGVLSELREANSCYSISLSEHEKRLISAYRDKPEMQPAVDRLLGIESATAKNIGEDIAETVFKTQNALNTKCNSNSK